VSTNDINYGLMLNVASLTGTTLSAWNLLFFSRELPNIITIWLRI
jgi:hypothetical protein